MSFNVSVLGKVFYVTPWMIYNTHSNSDQILAFNEFEHVIEHKQNDTNGANGANGANNANDEDVVQGKLVKVIEYVPEMSVGGVDEKDFTGVFPSYVSWAGIIGAGLAARYGYVKRHDVSRSFRQIFTSG